MKKHLICIALAVSLAALFSGCQKDDNNQKLTSLKTATEEYYLDIEKCKNTEYKYLDWNEAVGYPVDVIDSCREIKNGEPKTQPIEKQLQQFEEICETCLGEYDTDYACFDFDGWVSDIVAIEGTDKEAVTRPKLVDYMDKIKNGDIVPTHYTYIDHKRQIYLWWFPDTKSAHWYNKGTTLGMLDEYYRVSSTFPTDIGEPVAVYPNDGTHNDVKYTLIDGEFSVGEAIDYFQNNYMRSMNYDEKDICRLAVRQVNVYQITDEIYAYVFLFTRAVNSIPYDFWCERMSEGDENYRNVSENGQAVMIKKNDIDWGYFAHPVNDVETGREIKEIIRLTDAADILNDNIYGNYEVLFTDLVMTAESKGGEWDTLRPTWKFMLKNPNDDWNYDFYIDAISGEVNYTRYQIL